ncbi:hypothetical protein [Modicisalibacter sp. MOD 31.J]|uniref:hypothetical protein n=1 Tax=Modicisalibacter sp. MOD 31.J TaxID=2831897 RepID=UPI001CCA9C18|nr:hypothetical protein [Modicisalibacter sp. MOD 31.J]MBZ9574430.1 hypothetical protein [Modicisalibacter sp. MOD 31.J]
MGEDTVAQILAQLAEIQASVDEPSTGWFTVGAAVIGFLTAMLPTVLLEYLRRRHETRTLRASLSAEMAGISEIIRARDYVTELRKGAEDRPPTFQVNIPTDYFVVYKANTAKLGLLEPSEAKRIIRFYHLVESVIQDVTPGGILYEGKAKPDAFKQDADFLESALRLADEITSEPDANQGAK